MKDAGRGKTGFTLIEVTFATGILFLILVLLLGALSHLALVRELGERRHLATLCLTHCVERLHGQGALGPEPVSLAAPEALPGDYEIHLEPTEESGVARLVVTTQSNRGHVITVSALCVVGDLSHAP